MFVFQHVLMKKKLEQLFGDGFNYRRKYLTSFLSIVIFDMQFSENI
jgi:hypothetical protein